MTDAHVAEVLEELVPSYDHRDGDWARVAAAARRGRRMPLRLAVVVGLVVAVAALVLAWPFGNDRGGVLDRALAAVGDGPVLHVVLRGEWGGTLVDLESGERTPVYGETETWYDTDTGRAHVISRLGGVVQGEDVGWQKKPETVLAALGREYRQALEAGTARVAGDATVSGEAGVWITIHSELLPDVSDGKDHEWTQQVAVSKRTFDVVAVRETRDGAAIPGSQQRVIDVALVPRNDRDFIASRPSLNGTAVKMGGREKMPLENAATVLGRTPLWLGPSFAGVPLTHVYRETTAFGHQQRVRLTGEEADAARKCSDRRDEGDCLRAAGITSEVEVRSDGVFALEGPIEWGKDENAVVFAYGDVTVTETADRPPFLRGVGTYEPPAGSIFVVHGGTTGVLQRDGMEISIAAGNESQLLAAARGLVQMR